MITCCQKGRELTFLPISNQNNGWLPFTSCHVFQQPPSCSEIGHTWKMSDKLTKFTSNVWDGLAFRKNAFFLVTWLVPNKFGLQHPSPTSISSFWHLNLLPDQISHSKWGKFIWQFCCFSSLRKRRVIGLFHTVNVLQSTIL